MKFVPNEQAIAYAIANPYYMCKEPVNSAIGRVSESIIVQQVQLELGIEIAPYIDPHLPEQYKDSVFRKPFRHDGLVFSQGNFEGINETKMAIEKDFIRIPHHEVDVMNACIKRNLMYLLSFGKCHNIQTRECEYLGVVNLADIAKQDPSILVNDGYLQRIYLKNLTKHL